MKVVFDTNIFISALALRGSRAEEAMLGLGAYEGIRILSLRAYLEEH